MGDGGQPVAQRSVRGGGWEWRGIRRDIVDTDGRYIDVLFREHLDGQVYLAVMLVDSGEDRARPDRLTERLGRGGCHKLQLRVQL